MVSEEVKCYRLDVDENLLHMAKSTLSLNKDLISYKAKVFSLLGNEVRLKIMYLFLQYEKMCVCDLGDVLEMNQSPISQHLRKLKDAGLLENKREGMTIFYSITSDVKADIEQLIKDKI